jgi:putative ABC transport system substrate-binding protein
LVTLREQIADLAIKAALPTMWGHPEEADAGGLMAYGTDVPALYRRAATYVDKILKGARPGDLPVEQASKFELIVNVKTARSLGLTIPPAVLL